MYFQKFPLSFYSLDDRKTAQVITNFLLRVNFLPEFVNNFSVYDLHDVQDGETPEMLAFQYYGDTNLHWVVLHANEVLDPRFEWILSVNNLNEYVSAKYDKINGVHHYEDSNGRTVAGNLNLTVNTTTGFSVGAPITNDSDNNIGYITSIPSSTSLIVTATKGGFQSGDQISLTANANVVANVSATTSISGTAVTNFLYEDRLNEQKRRVKIIKPQFIELIMSEFESKISQ